jgi:hypothetical protein
VIDQTFHVAIDADLVRRTVVPVIYEHPSHVNNSTLRANTITQALTQAAPKHLSPEATYRFYERLGILCGDKPATPEQLQTALLEANEYDLNSED